jgi:membrane protein DedA with SNARE-associated domain
MHDLIIQAIEQGGYLGIFVLMMLENIFPPIPSEVIMGLGGVLVGQGRMQFWPLLLAGTIGSTLGNYTWFWAGDTWGYQRLRPFIERRGRWLTLEWEDVERATAFFIKRGQWTIFFARFLPVFRTLISLPAGLAHMGKVRFLAYTFLGAAVWNAFLIMAGSMLADAEHILGWIVGGIIVVTLAGYLWRVATWKPRADR